MSLMNAPFVLDEVAAALSNFRQNSEGRTIYLSQFPLTPADLAFLTEFLGVGHAIVEVRGISRSVWRETSYPGVWWGEYYSANPTKPALTTIEVCAFPPLASAPVDDVAEGLARFEAALPELRPQEVV